MPGKKNEELRERIASLAPRQRALLELAWRKQRGLPEPIAVVGMGCRFPGDANDPDAFWKLLGSGKEAVSGVPADRWTPASTASSNPAGGQDPRQTRRGGFLKNIAGFDPFFFGISPREAAHMDPQQRILLEVTWEAMEDAGIDPDTLAGTRTGVFVGIAGSEYGALQLFRGRDINTYTHTGSLSSIASNRISYVYDFRGPSMSIDTACSSSLVAVHQAIRSLWSGESDASFAGGVNLLLTPEVMDGFDKLGVLSPAGRCYSFDSRAEGIVRGEGAGIILLKRLGDAIKSGDKIHAVIRGSATNQDGRSFGLTAPNQKAQEDVLRQAYENAGVSPGSVRYIEAHGTGTPLGDPIEAQALGAVLGDGRESDGVCYLGTVKTNFGHLEAAAGIAGLMKSILTLKHRQVLPGLNFDKPNKHIPFDDFSLRVPAAPVTFPAADGTVLAGVSSFGFGGTNAHVVLDDGPRIPDELPSAKAGPYLFVLSARDPEALRALAQLYLDQLDAEAFDSPYDLCYSVARRRSHHDLRLAVVFDSFAHLRESLAEHLNERIAPEVFSGRATAEDITPGLSFVFPGQGPNWWPLAPSWFEDGSTLYATLQECAEYFREWSDWDLIAELKSEQDFSARGAAFLQSALFAIQAALTRELETMGIRPRAVIGHSMGEVGAAFAAGTLSLRDACRVIFHRGHLIEGLIGQGGSGRMALIELGARETRELLRPYAGQLFLAALNGPSSVVISGEEKALNDLAAEVTDRGVFFRILESVHFAAHCSFMDPLLEPLQQRIADIRSSPLATDFYSTVSGERVPAGDHLGAEYWSRNLREPVSFYPAVQNIMEDGHTFFLEIAPHPVQSNGLKSALSDSQLAGLALPAARREQNVRRGLLEVVAGLYTGGYPIQFEKLFPETGRFQPLPLYPFQRQPYWFTTEEGADIDSGNGRGGGLPPRAPEIRIEAPALTTETPARREELVQTYLRTQVARVLRFRENALEKERSLRSLGIDSLMAVDLKNQIESAFKVRVTVLEFLEGGTIQSLSAKIAADWGKQQSPGIATPEEAPTDRLTVPETKRVLPVTPPQEWFFSHDLAFPHQWNSTLLLEVPADTRIDYLEQAAQYVAERHEVYSLRFRFLKEENKWVQEFGSATNQNIFQSLDYSKIAAEDFPGELDRYLAELHQSLHIEEGPLARVVYFDRGPGVAGRLFILLHHLITDGFGLSLFAGAMKEAYLSLLESGRLPASRDPDAQYSDYTREMLKVSATPDMKSSLAFWTAGARGRPRSPLPREFPAGEQVDGALLPIDEEFTVEQTRQLMSTVPEAHATDFLGLFLAAIVRSFSGWTGDDALRIETELHGRHSLGFDASRIHGWCNIMYPLLLSGGLSASMRETLSAIKAELAAVPEDGLSYGLLKYLSDDPDVRGRMQALPEPEVKVLYFGTMYDSIRAAAAPFLPAAESRGPEYAEGNQTKYLFYIYGGVMNEQMRLQILYNKNIHRRETIQSLLAGIKSELTSTLLP